MVRFFRRELLEPEWVIALSRTDALGFVDRSDHGTTGSYAAWPPLSFEALATLSGSFDDATAMLLSQASSARQGPYGQSSAVQAVLDSSTRPETVAAVVQTPFKSTIGANRYSAVAGGCWFDVIVRTVFGWRPQWTDALRATAAGGAAKPPPLPALWQPTLPRRLNATLSNLRYHGTLVEIVSDASGVRARVQPAFRGL